MEGWKRWEGKKVYIRLRTDRSYSGTIIEVDDKVKPITFITIIDKYGSVVTFANSEIIEIKEET